MPGRAHLRPRSRSAPATSGARRRRGGRAGCTKSGASRASRRSSSGATARARSPQRACGKREAARAGVEHRVDGVRAWRGAPQLERRAELEDPAVVRLEQRLGLLGGQRLDAERSRERDHDALRVAGRGGAPGRGRRGRTRSAARPRARAAGSARRGTSRGVAVRRIRAAISPSGSRCWWRSVRMSAHIRTKPMDLVGKARASPRPGVDHAQGDFVGIPGPLAELSRPAPRRCGSRPGCRPSRPAGPRRRSPRRRCRPRAAARRACPRSASRGPRA